MKEGQKNQFITSPYKDDVRRGRVIGSWTIESEKLPENNMVAVRCTCGTRSHVIAYHLFNGYSLKCAKCCTKHRATFKMTAIAKPNEKDFPNSTKEKEDEMIAKFLKDK